MPINCSIVSAQDVIDFFKSIDGMGKKDRHPRNEGVPNSIRLSQRWELCELTQDEFLRLEIPDGTHTLIKDKNEATFDALVKSNIRDRIKILNSGKFLDPLIIRTKLKDDSEDASFYIEDGAKRAISYKVFFESNKYTPVRAYIGIR